MKVLALETSGSNCSAAIVSSDTVIANFDLNIGTTHSENLMPMIEQIQTMSKVSMENIDVLSCSIGPGSFTGLRIGMASLKGMALSLNKPVIGVSSLLCLAYNVPYFDGIICSMIDAKNNNVYAANFKFDGKPIMIGDYISDTIDVLLDIVNNFNKKVLFIGDGAIAYKEKIMDKLKDNAYFVPYHLNTQNAVSVAKAAIDRASQNDYDDYNTIAPLYLKKSQAERELGIDATNIN